MKYYRKYHVVTMNYTILKQSLLLYWKEHLDLKMLCVISKIHLFFFFSFFFQRLVEAAEDAYLKHEFDADLQVINNYFLKYLSSEYIITVYTIACMKNCCRKPNM